MLTLHSAQSYVLNNMRDWGYTSISLTDSDYRLEDGIGCYKVTGHASHTDGHTTSFDWDVWINEDGSLYGEW